MARTKIQSGNPNRLTVHQHTFPAASIARFAGASGLVQVRASPEARRLELNPRDPFFCLYRAWDNTSEVTFMKSVEDRFQVLAERVLTGSQLGGADHVLVSQFYALCRLRAEQARSPCRDINAVGVLEGAPLSSDQQEKLEKNGYICANGTVFPGRMMAGVRIQVLVPHLCSPETHWSIIRTTGLEFLAPDSFGQIGVVPLSPQACLVASASDGYITDENVRAINKLALEQVARYYFARDFSACGLPQDAA